MTKNVTRKSAAIRVFPSLLHFAPILHSLESNVNRQLRLLPWIIFSILCCPSFTDSEAKRLRNVYSQQVLYKVLYGYREGNGNCSSRRVYVLYLHHCTIRKQLTKVRNIYPLVLKE